MAVTEVRRLSPLTSLRLMLELPPHTFLFPMFLFRKAATVIFYVETEKLRHGSFPKTPSKSADGEGFSDSYRQ